MSYKAENQELTPFFAVSPLVCFPHTSGGFDVYIRQKENFLLYIKAGQEFTMSHRQRLYDHGVRQIWVQNMHAQSFDDYVENHLGNILQDDRTPIKERSRILYDISSKVVGQAFADKVPKQLSSRLFSRMQRVVKHALAFMNQEVALKSMGSLINHTYETYTHCVHVMIFATAILRTFDVEPEVVADCGLGALLHDLGKARVPASILKKPGKLDAEQRRMVNNHPLWGAAMCANLPLSHTASNCILFHHERQLGGGYPSGISGDEIPLAVKCVTVADVYDALTTRRAYGNAIKPFEALLIMRDEMKGHFDYVVFKRLVKILSGADLIDNTDI